MIISADDIKGMPEFENQNYESITRKLNGIENLIRSYTNNNFQNRHIRFATRSFGNSLYDCRENIRSGDTVQITDSINAGLYVVENVDPINKIITVDSNLNETDYNLVTKIEYPAAIVDGVVNLLLWDINQRGKIGIQSETLSRHSVTYSSQDSSHYIMGYPASLFGFLKPFMKARF